MTPILKPLASRLRAFMRYRRVRSLLKTRSAVTMAYAVAILRADHDAARAFKADLDALQHSLWLAGYQPSED